MLVSSSRQVSFLDFALLNFCSDVANSVNLQMRVKPQNRIIIFAGITRIIWKVRRLTRDV